MVGAGSSYIDELMAVWKLTAPAKFTHERMRVAEWDGIVAGGATASSLLEFGDLHLSPYRLYAPKRINSRISVASFAKRTVSRDEVVFVHGLPVTRPERTVFDLVVDDEDLSLVAGVLRDAVHADREFDFKKFLDLLESRYGKVEGEKTYRNLLANSGLIGEVTVP